MFSIFKKQDKPFEYEAMQLYNAAMEKARQEKLYEAYAVPDSMDGRFEMVALHVVLIMRRLNSDKSRTELLSQALFDIMFADMDESLRAVGIGDMGITKRMKFLMRGFNGRAHIYSAALDAKDVEALKMVLSKNVYEERVSDKKLELLAQYVIAHQEKLEGNGLGDLVSGVVKW